MYYSRGHSVERCHLALVYVVMLTPGSNEAKRVDVLLLYMETCCADQS